MKVSLLVTVDVPDTTDWPQIYDDDAYHVEAPTKTSTRNFVRNAVESWGKQFHRLSPWFNLDVVSVKFLKDPKK